MKRMVCFICITALLSGVTFMPLHAEEKQASLQLRNMRSYNVTEQQLESLKAQEGMTFYAELPDVLPEGHMAVAMPEELGGGFLAGTAADIASAFNAAGITVGLTAASVTGATAIIGGVIIVTFAGVLINAINTTSTHKH